jgi:diguanylate cyclase (GGDEF)-like protein
MLDGIKELGYDNYIWGKFNREAMGMEFNLDALQYGKERVTIPLLDDTFFLTKVSWSGAYHYVEDASKIDCRYDDLILLSEGPAFVIPVLKNRRFQCYQYYKCNMNDCPAYMSNDQKCWVRGMVKCDSHIAEPVKNPKENCFHCNLFSVEGVLIVKEERNGKELKSEHIGSIVGLVNEASLALEIADLYEETERMSITDSLTGLYNHKEFFKLLRGELDRAKRFNTDLSLLMIDVDNFKIFNDTYGHLTGDMALKMISKGITRAVRKIDIVSRYGGEEFTAILPETDQSGAIVLAERIKNEVASMNMSPVEDERVTLTVSIGICSCPAGNMTPDQIVSRADDASYLAKKTGKNRICISDRM